MNKLFKMEFANLKKEKLLWIGLIIILSLVLLFNLLFLLYRYVNGVPDYALFSNLTFNATLGIGGITGNIGLIMLIIVLLHNFQYGTIRSQITVGYSRTEIFFSNLIICLALGLGIYLISILFSLGISILFFSGASLVFSTVIKSILYGLLINALVICFICFIAFSTASMWVTIIVTVAINALTSTITAITAFISGFSNVTFINFLPWVQITYIQQGGVDVLKWWQVVPVNIVLSGLLIYFTILIFKKKDIK
ncbi:MAG: ABC transporter permease [Bacilli bacterium]